MNIRIATSTLILTTVLFAMGCSTPPAVDPTLAPTPLTENLEESIPTSLEVEQLGEKPNDPITIQGVGFPENEVIVFYFAESETNLGPSVAQVVSSGKGDFRVDLLLPTAWPGANFEGQSRLLVVAESIKGDAIASGPIVIDYANALTQFENSAAGYVVDIPTTWGSTEPQITPLGELILLGPDPITPGNPGNSVIISASLDVLNERAAAQSLTCGSPGCTDEIKLEITTVNGLDARRVTIGQENTPQLDWYFIRYADRLIYFTLHDPLTLETLDGLVQTFTLTEALVDNQEGIEAEVAMVEEVATEVTTEPSATPTLEVNNTDTPTPTKDAPTPTEEPTATATLAETPTTEPSPSPALSPTIEPTLTNTPTLIPTETPTETPTSTQSPTTEPTATSIATETATPTDLPTEEPTPTQADEDTSSASSETPTVGPLQTSLDLFTILSRFEESEETLAFFTAESVQSIGSPAGILDFLELDSRPFSFQAERIQGVAPPIVRVTIQSSSDAPPQIRDLEMVNQFGNWQISQVNIIDPE